MTLSSHLKQKHHSYIQACQILSSTQPEIFKYEKAGEHLSSLENDFKPGDQMPSISPEELTKIAMVNRKALSYIFSNTHFSEKLGINHLTQLANHSLKAASYILYDKHFLKKFGKDRLASNLKEGRYHFINALAQNRVESYYND